MWIVSLRQKTPLPGLQRAAALVAWAGLALSVGCDRGPTQPSMPSQTDAGPAPATLHQQALGRDPEPADESLPGLLAALKDRFACNNVSGCAAHQALLRYGWGARPALEHAFARAPAQAQWRARAVAILADLADPQSKELLAHLLEDRDPEVRAWAAIGLGNLGAVEYRARIAELADTSDGLWTAPARIGALFVLAAWGEHPAAMRFAQDLHDLGRSQLATTALMIGADLCLRAHAPDCSAALPVMARHPAFQARRAALRAMTARLRPSYARALVFLSADQAQSIRREAEDALAVLAGRTDINGAAAWGQWCEQGGCADKGPQ